MLQQQLIQQTALMQQPSGDTPLIDANLLAQIQTLTNQLLEKTERTDDAGFNKVGRCHIVIGIENIVMSCLMQSAPKIFFPLSCQTIGNI